jgi:uncharacterized membrane protein YhaH (DUF805 family)
MSISKMLFSYEWRINRAPYWGYTILASIILNVLIILAAFSWSTMVMQLSTLLYIPFIWVAFAILVKRLHDLDKSWWMALLALIPLVNLYISIICGFFKWTEWKNQYWDNPLGNTLTQETPSTQENNSSTEL